MGLLNELLNIVIPGRARKQLHRDPRYINQQCANTLFTPENHPLRDGYVKRCDENEKHF